MGCNTIMKNKITYSNFVKWVETIDPSKEFNYGDNHHCVFASFLVNLGYDKVWVGTDRYSPVGMYAPLTGKKIPKKILSVIDYSRVNSGSFISKQNILDAIKKIK